MKAPCSYEHGELDVLQYADVPDPTPGQGKLRPVIDRVMPLSEGREAFAVMERGEQFGKIVLLP